MRSHRVVSGALVLGLVTIPLGASAATAPSPGAATVLPWIEDAHSRAVAEAKARKLPMFVESWAPW